LGRILSTHKERSQAETGTVYPAPIIAPAYQVQTQSPPPARPQTSHVPVAEQKTQIYQRPSSEEGDESPTQSTPAQGAIRVPANGGNAPALATDWTAVALGIIALIALLGLIPLWFMVYLAWTG